MLLDEYLDNQMTEGLVLQLLQALSLSLSSPIEQHMDKLLDKMNSLIGAAMIPSILVNLANKNKVRSHANKAGSQLSSANPGLHCKVFHRGRK